MQPTVSVNSCQSALKSKEHHVALGNIGPVSSLLLFGVFNGKVAKVVGASKHSESVRSLFYVPFRRIFTSVQRKRFTFLRRNS